MVLMIGILLTGAATSINLRRFGLLLLHDLQRLIARILAVILLPHFRKVRDSAADRRPAAILR